MDEVVSYIKDNWEDRRIIQFKRFQEIDSGKGTVVRRNNYQFDYPSPTGEKHRFRLVTEGKVIITLLELEVSCAYTIPEPIDLLHAIAMMLIDLYGEKKAPKLKDSEGEKKAIKAIKTLLSQKNDLISYWEAYVAFARSRAMPIPEKDSMVRINTLDITERKQALNGTIPPELVVDMRKVFDIFNLALAEI